jgi:hypothetical protein
MATGKERPTEGRYITARRCAEPPNPYSSAWHVATPSSAPSPHTWQDELECPSHHTQCAKHLQEHSRPRTLAWLYAQRISIGLLHFLDETRACAKPRATWEPG